jgi:hypothetical protein
MIVLRFTFEFFQSIVLHLKCKFNSQFQASAHFPPIALPQKTPAPGSSPDNVNTAQIYAGGGWESTFVS